MRSVGNFLPAVSLRIDSHSMTGSPLTANR